MQFGVIHEEMYRLHFVVKDNNVRQIDIMTYADGLNIVWIVISQNDKFQQFLVILFAVKVLVIPFQKNRILPTG